LPESPIESPPEDGLPPEEESADETKPVTAIGESLASGERQPAETVVGQTGKDPFAAYAAWPLLHQRLRATAQWLLDPGGNGWTIQLMTLTPGDEAAVSLERHLQRLNERGIPLERIGVYRAPAGADRKGHLGLLYGRYTSREAARSASSGLPPALRVKRFLLRSVTSLRRDSELVPGN
jgi:septal ring-binding cell division protein DamX